jgi:hypothetical protein
VLKKDGRQVLIELKEKNPNKQILYFDESRFGTKTKTGLGWFLKGSRTSIKVKLGFKNLFRIFLNHILPYFYLFFSKILQNIS